MGAGWIGEGRMADKRIPAARIRAVWLDEGLTTTEAARLLGMTRSNLWRRAVLLGLPARKRSGPKRKLTDFDLLDRLWRADVRAADIAAHLGVRAGHLCNTAAARGLPRRPKGLRPVPLAEYLLREGLARSAAETRARLRAVERSGAVPSRPRVAA